MNDATRSGVQALIEHIHENFHAFIARAIRAAAMPSP